MKTPDELLEGAIEIIERDGWYQGSLAKCPEEEGGEAWEAARDTAPVCAMGALHRASSGKATEIMYHDEESFQAAMDRLKKVVLAVVPRSWTPNWYDVIDTDTPATYAVTRWNDKWAESKEDVILGLKRALHDR